MIEFKQAKKEKLPAIVSLNREIFSEMYERDPYTLSEYEERLSTVLPIIFIAEENEKLVGDSIAFAKDDAWYLWILGVHPGYRKIGIANTLFEMNENYAKSKGFKKVNIKIYSVSEAMLRLAEKRGYTATRTDEPNEQKYFIVNLPL